ncbi:hypothetical protein [Pseudomonas mosselii]|uniref:hypothetical protein n=1 Tax=Pseudomonas mosselii TaxID=78327 RepID=UPI000D9F49C2|nr:hypothetical protein [Pseudomonas mosselii]PYC28783.1 hypothetical protein DMX06_01005 [Pseudomonas mosselii]
MSICFAITDADWALTKDVFSIISTVVSAIGVGLGAWVGFSGLATWRRQNKGTSDHDLSRRLLIDLYRLRDGISHVRNPVILSGEGGAQEQDKNLTFNQRNYRDTAKAYQNRFSLIDEVRARLNAALLESEALWGEEAKSLFHSIFKLQHELWNNVRTYLVTINPDEKDDIVQSYERILKKRRDVLYESPLDEGDAFKNELDTALVRVEEYLRPKLIT